MKLVPSILLVACLVGATMIEPAMSQPGPAGGGGPGGGPAGGGPGGGQSSPTFPFTVCNKSTSQKIYIAVVSIVGQTFRAQGWWTVANGGQCTKIGDFQRPGVYVHASDPQG